MLETRQVKATSQYMILQDDNVKTFNIATIPADGIGPEVIDAGVAVLEALASRDGRFSFNFVNFDWGSDYYKAHGRMMPEIGRAS